MEPTIKTRLYELYHGDSREIMPHLQSVEAIITDPVWPNAPDGMFPVSNPGALLADVLLKTEARRMVICLRNDSDPRFLAAVPEKYKFIQCMWMRYACVGHMNRFLTGNEVAYAFGDHPIRKPGRISIPAMSPVETKPVKRDSHPCPRSLKHMSWLVANWCDESVLDPFMGSGTTGCAAIANGIYFIGIESDEKYFDAGARRLEEFAKQGMFDFSEPIAEEYELCKL